MDVPRFRVKVPGSSCQVARTDKHKVRTVLCTIVKDILLCKPITDDIRAEVHGKEAVQLVKQENEEGFLLLLADGFNSRF